MLFTLVRSKAGKRCAKAGRTNVLFQEGSASALPFAAASFDVVVTRLSFHHFDEPRKVLAEMLRVLKPGGTLAVADVVSAEDPEQAALQNAIETLRDPSHVRMLPASELMALMTGPGLSVTRQEPWDKPREFEEWVGIVANPGDDMLIPYLGQQRTTALFQQPALLFGLMAGDIRRRQPFLAIKA